MHGASVHAHIRSLPLFPPLPVLARHHWQWPMFRGIPRLRRRIAVRLAEIRVSVSVTLLLLLLDFRSKGNGGRITCNARGCSAVAEAKREIWRKKAAVVAGQARLTVGKVSHPCLRPYKEVVDASTRKKIHPSERNTTASETRKENNLHVSDAVSLSNAGHDDSRCHRKQITRRTSFAGEATALLGRHWRAAPAAEANHQRRDATEMIG